MIAAFEVVGERLDGVSTEEEFFDAFAEFSDVDTRFNAACTRLQQIADDNDIDVDLDCQPPTNGRKPGPAPA